MFKIVERLFGKQITQFLKFGLVGVSNTAISYGIEMLCYYVLLAGVSWPEDVQIAVTSAVAFFVSVTNSYFWNSRFVFGDGQKKSLMQHVRAYFKSAASYALTGLLLAPLLKMRLSGAGMQYWLASILSLIVSVPINYVMNKFWAFSKQKKQDEKR